LQRSREGALVAELMLFRRAADGRDVELPGSTVALEVELQRRVEAGMEAMLGIRFLASEYPTGPWPRGRIDTLGLDENGAPVVVEYKETADSGVLSQASSYLS
jgi:RecB family endonuclease NucS